MSKRNLNWSESKYNQYLKEHRGEGEGADYAPWLKIQDFPSQGRVTRILGITTGRMHSLFSDLETRCFYIFDWSNNVIDIREQFPLLPREKTIRIAEQIGVAHPCANQLPIVMTTDFLLTVKDKRGAYNVAITVKPSPKLDEKRVLEKLEIERRFWAEKNVDWGIVTEKDISKELIKNIQKFHSFYNFEAVGISADDLNDLASQLKSFFVSKMDVSIQKNCQNFDVTYDLQQGSAMSIFRYLVAHREILVDMNVNFDMRASFNKMGCVFND